MHYFPNKLFAKQKKNYTVQRIERILMHYKNTENCMKMFQNFKSLTICLLSCLAEVSAQILFDKNSNWHHACYQKFTKSRLERPKTKRKKR